MSFFYPHTVTVTRPEGQTAVGAVGYGGLSPKKEQLIAAEVSADIQIASTGGAPAPKLPGDAEKRTLWTILISAGEVADGVIQTRDIVTDEQGNRLQVITPYYTFFGYQLTAERLEV